VFSRFNAGLKKSIFYILACLNLSSFTNFFCDKKYNQHIYGWLIARQPGAGRLWRCFDLGQNQKRIVAGISQDHQQPDGTDGRVSGTGSVYSDSSYVVKAVMEGWLTKWLRTNFKGGIKNSDLWLRYHELSQKHKIKFIWVKGHANNVMNNRCDVLATEAADGKNLLIDEGYEAAMQK
jgi:hypothetical protein